MVSEATDGTAKNTIAGEWGHNPLPWPQQNELPGKPCYCGQLGCIETWLSGPGFERDHQTFNNLSQTLSAKDIVKNALHSDEKCKSSLQRYELRFTKSLASIINVLDPVTTRLVPPKHGDSSGVRGAA